MIYENIIQTIRNTALGMINKLNPESNVAIYTKIEYNSPSGSR
jgi:cysteine synthase